MPIGLEERAENLEERTDSLETVLGQFISSMNALVIRVEGSVSEFKEEIRADTKKFKEESRADTKKFKDEIGADTKRFKKEMNKRWGELSNKLGSLVEDMVAPNIPEIARKYFGDPEFDFFGVRIKKRREPFGSEGI